MTDDSILFAGINILFFEDFMQLPFVLDMTDKITCFSSSIDHKPSKHIKRKCTANPLSIENQISALQSRVLENNRINSYEWKNVTFLITRNDLYIQLNFNATKEHAYDNNHHVIYFCAQDSYNKRILTRNNHLKFLSTPDTKENTLCSILPLSINMNVVLTTNICTNDNLQMAH
ncbi:16175_t:CDS:2 [Cetraspora pellucida]|uniref:16175_t:CDS:1 n=1 Tax=Cetraspora pellucida TaxID=1433469 RepID=A0A9N9BL15_9GLOM|nr:16175_t:CDS:2 [Cetraspora pellucida]